MIGDEKITKDHLGRRAVVYVRQSTPNQVRNHRESLRVQRGLAEKVRELGFRDVEVIEDDLGRSGSGLQERPGFGRLLASVCDGAVGIVTAFESARLSRNNRDWYHLLDLCALTDTLVADAEKVYDPRSLDDRLLLGLKGAMSEFEVGLFRQRGRAALLQMIHRGEVLTEVPVGYVRTEDNRCEMTPDRQVREAVHGVFRKFRELGSARQVLLFFRGEEIPLPTARPGRAGREVLWELPIRSRIVYILKNPVYAGAFVYGRTRSRTKLVEGRGRKTPGHAVPMEEWQVLIRDHHEGYISWADYLRNQEVLEANANMEGRMATGAAKKGTALLSGLLRCRRCGRRFHVLYSGGKRTIARYQCRGGEPAYGTRRCISFAARTVDAAVSEVVLQALAPAGIEAALAAWDLRLAEED